MSDDHRYGLIDVEDVGELCCGRNFTKVEAEKLCFENGWKIEEVMENIILVDTQPNQGQTNG